jgi:ABC-type transport system involved in multi-copper enzyme maturation permease subunit
MAKEVAMRKVLAISQAVLADAGRRKVVWVVGVFTALLAIAIPGLPSYGVGIVDGVFRQVAIALMWLAAFVVALALSATRISQEVERRSVFNVVSRDVRRWQYVVGTWLGMFAVLGLVLLAFATATIAIGWFTYGHAMPLLYEAAFAVWLELGIIMAFTVMLSTQFGPVTSVIGGLTLAFVGHAAVDFLHLGELDRAPIWFPSLDTFNVINPVALGGGVSWVYLVAMVVLFLGYCGLFLSLGSLMFARRDL